MNPEFEVACQAILKAIDDNRLLIGTELCKEYDNVYPQKAAVILSDLNRVKIHLEEILLGAVLTAC